MANLRGVKESGRIFAGPTYIYVVRAARPDRQRALPGVLRPTSDRSRDSRRRRRAGQAAPRRPASRCFILLRAFSSGAVALSGVEAISNGVPAFKRPEPRNAAMTLVAMGTILGDAASSASASWPTTSSPSRRRTARRCCPSWARPCSATAHFLYYVLQFSTFAILILAANTAYADFPRLSSIIARDGYLPRQLANRGDRLVFSNGMLVLAGFASILIIVFERRRRAP